MERKSLIHEEKGGKEPRSSCVLPHILGLPMTWLQRAHRKGGPVPGAALASELSPDRAGQRVAGAVISPPHHGSSFPAQSFCLCCSLCQDCSFLHTHHHLSLLNVGFRVAALPSMTLVPQLQGAPLSLGFISGVLSVPQQPGAL